MTSPSPEGNGYATLKTIFAANSNAQKSNDYEKKNMVIRKQRSANNLLLDPYGM